MDYRESAPAKASRDMYLTGAGEVDKTRARYSHKSVGVPGTVAGLLRALHEFGSMTAAEVIAPALALAQYGIVVTPTLAQGLERRAKRMQRWPNTDKIFYKSDGSFYQPGDLLVQADLAWSLGQIAHHGEAAFYTGAIAKRLVEEMASNGGLIEAQDLAAYRVVIREPVWGEYRGFKVASMPPPSSGGVHLVQILNVLEGYPIAHLGHNSASTMHLMAEAMRYAYADRSKHLGDPSFHAVPVAGLVSKAYARTIRAKIDQHRATPSADVAPGKPSKYESRETTHFSIMDRQGNVVSNTYTINFSFGTGIVAGGTGILLNNEMDDFSAKPGVANAYGLLGGEANAIEAGKRPLSSMTPTIVFKDGKPFFATGTPGGSRIITTTLQLVMNVIDHGMNIAQATAAPRMHHQWFPDELRIEQGVSPDTVAALSRLGHKVVTKRSMGSAQTVMRDGPWFMGASDPRRPGAWAAGLAQ
ncbi:MAG: gamma-glutamyltranspeptidase/glutathione hydrolase [Gammaproteobacteria bacterium]